MEAANYEIHVAQARAKAKAIEHEAELILSNSNIKVKEAELEAKRKYEDRTITLKKEHSEKMLELEKKERTYKEELKKITKDREDLQVLQTSANALFDEGQQLKEEYTSKVNEALMVLERSAGLTQNEAKEIVLAKVEENLVQKLHIRLDALKKRQNKISNVVSITSLLKQQPVLQVSSRLSVLSTLLILKMTSLKVVLLVKRVAILKLLKCLRTEKLSL